MYNKRCRYRWMACLLLLYTACNVPKETVRRENRLVPDQYNSTQDTTNPAGVKWRDYFTDPDLIALIDTALEHNQELNILAQEIAVRNNEIREKKGEYLPFAGIKAGAGLDKVGRYTNIGAMEEATEIKPGKAMPDPLPDFMVAGYASWEADIWHKLHNAKKAALSRYLSSIEGRNFAVTNLVAEIAEAYYELLALDNQLEIVSRNVDIQTQALRIVKLQKEATQVTELAVRRFEAQVLHTQSLQYGIRQQITETENKINYLLGRYPQPIRRSSNSFDTLVPHVISAGLPSQLLANRPDIRQAELDLQAARLDVQAARARFYPAVGITASVGYQAFDPGYLLRTPASLLYGLAGDLAAPLVNRNAIRAAYSSANARQLQAVYNYERTVLKGYMEVYNQLSRISNLEKGYALKSRQVAALVHSVDIANTLFSATRADYMEVLMTQRDALESKFELVETRQQQLNAMVNIYRALGGGWK
ncbi:RND transporter [Chitinophaga parva]|uniref:RND transporter n=1 Tax=Chitinophaga parva TaxID=2169414 RepID=A0A2T7BC00_9BACT|nr:efflux transporter outer membrane subunit [Chitinophaga parva]PUZ22609.1 RND transporter [Chitinophaga parva]